MNKLLKALLSPTLLYKIAVGGYRYYRYLQRTDHDRTRFRRRGGGVLIHEGVTIDTPENLVLGDCVYIGPQCWIDAKGGCRIGSHSGVGARSTILTTDHRHAGADTLPFSETLVVKPVVIEDLVWVGMNVKIWPGVRIGEGAIVAMGSVVTRDVPPLAIVSGNPAEIIGHRRRDAFERLKAEGAFTSFVPTGPVRTLWVPPFIRRKYRDDLPELGFDISEGKEYFEQRRR